MDKRIKKFQKAFIIFTIAQIFILLGLFDYFTQVKALSDWLFIFTIMQLIGCILMVVSAIMLVDFNRNYFYLFVTAIIETFVILLASVADESVEDFTVAWSRGLAISGDILLGLIYIYFFLGTRDYFKENGLGENVKRSKVGFWVIVISMIVINLVSFVRTFNIVKTNYIVASILRYGSLLLEFIMYGFVFVVLLLMIILMQKKRKEALINEKPEEQ